MDITKGYTGEPNQDNDGLTYDSIHDAINYLKSPKADLYYAKSDYTKRGEFYLIPKSSDWPELLVCHTDDFESVEDKLSVYCNLIPISTYRHPESVEETAMKGFTEHVMRLCAEIVKGANVG